MKHLPEEYEEIKGHKLELVQGKQHCSLCGRTWGELPTSEELKEMESECVTVSERERIWCREIGVTPKGLDESGEMELEVDVVHDDVAYYSSLHISQEMWAEMGKVFTKKENLTFCEKYGHDMQDSRSASSPWPGRCCRCGVIE